MITITINNTNTPTDFLSKHPILISLLSLIIFWLFRSQTYVGDGDQLSRIIEANYWFVQTELLSQLILQLTYQILHPTGFDGLLVMNLVSCISGALTVWVLLIYNRDYIGIHGIWPIALLASSGLLILCFGHTEYYTMFMASLFFYSYIALGYLHGKYSMLQTTLAFSLSLWIHLGILFSLPALLILPLLKKNLHDYKGFLIGAIPIVLAFFFKKNFELFGITVHGLSPSVNFVPLFQASDEQFYTMFEWGHLTDILWAWGMRSWIFWPIILIGILRFGFSSLLSTERIFLLLYALCFLFFTWTWHPNLGIENDWDLFSIAAIPSLLLALSYLPQLLSKKAHKYLLAIPLIASILTTFSFVNNRMEIEQRGYGSFIISPTTEIEAHVTVNGHQKDLHIVSIREGKHLGKVIDKTHQNVHNFYFYVIPDQQTTIPLTIHDNQSNTTN